MVTQRESDVTPPSATARTAMWSEGLTSFRLIIRERGRARNASKLESVVFRNVSPSEVESASELRNFGWDHTVQTIRVKMVKKISHGFR